MSEEDFEDPTEAGEDGEDIGTEHTRRLQRFIALGGGVPLQQELRNLQRLQHGERVSLKENVTDGHRALVADLVAAGLGNETIGLILGIDESYVRQLFEYELGTGFDLAKANLVRSLYQQGLSGSTRAALGWLRNHNRSNWRSKTELTGAGGGAIEAEVEHKGKSVEEAKAWLGSVIGAIMVDPELRNKEDLKTPVPGKDLKSVTPVGAKVKRSIRKPRREDDEEQS